MAYIAAVRDAIAANPATTGQRVAVKIYSAGTSVLGVPMQIIVVGTPDNIANLDAGRNDGAFWRGDRRHDVAGRRPLAGQRPPRLRLDHGDAARQRAGRRRGDQQAALRAGRAHGLLEPPAAGDLDVFIQPARNPDGRDPIGAHDGVGVRPQPRPRHRTRSGERADVRHAVKYPGLFFIDAHQQTRATSSRPTRTRPSTRSRTSRWTSSRTRSARLQQQFNDQSSQYRNYNTYDLFVPEYGDTVPALLMGGAGMTYEKGNNENYGKQVYDHYLAIDATVNAVARDKTALMTDWVSSGRRRSTRARAASCSTNTLVSPPASDLLDTARRTAPEPDTGLRLLLPARTARGRRRARSATCSGRACTCTGSTRPPRRGRARVRQLDVTPQGGPSPARPSETLPAGTLYIPMAQPHEALDPGGARREPVPAVPLLLRRSRGRTRSSAASRQRLPDAAAAAGRADDRDHDPALGSAPPTGRPSTRSTRTRCRRSRW